MNAVYLAVLVVALPRVVLKGPKGDAGLCVDPAKQAMLDARYLAKTGGAMSGPLVPAQTTRSLWVGGPRFMPLGDPKVQSIGRWPADAAGSSGLTFGAAGASNEMHAVAHLPDGAVVSGATCLADAGGATALSVSLLRLHDQTYTTCSDTPAVQHQGASTIVDVGIGTCGGTVSNDLANLNVFTVLAAANGAVTLYGCSIHYTLSVAAP